jgi:hypothetical protein
MAEGPLTRNIPMAVLCAYLPGLDSVYWVLYVAIIPDYWPKFLFPIRSPSVRRLQVGTYTSRDPLSPGGSLAQRCTYLHVTHSTWRRFGIARRLLAGSSRLPCSSATHRMTTRALIVCLVVNELHWCQHGLWIFWRWAQEKPGRDRWQCWMVARVCLS